MTPLSIIPGEQPDELDLELLRAGAIDDPATRALVEAAAAGPLAEVDAELEAYREVWARARPPLFPESESDVASETAAPRRMWGMAGAALALAAAVVLAVAGLSSGPGAVDATPSGVRAMGALPVDVLVQREGAPMAAPWRFAPGDTVRVQLVAPVDGFVHVWTVQGDGAVSPLVVDEPVSAGAPFRLAGAAQLDEHAGGEWLMVTVTDAELGSMGIDERARRALPDPTRAAGPRTWVLDITRRPTR